MGRETTSATAGAAPRLVSTLLVRDEIDIVEAHLRHHLAAGVCAVVVTDNGSADGTRAVLEEYSRLGSVLVIDEPRQDFSQPDWVSRMARIAYEKLGADWVLHSDADEFWFPGGPDLPSFFSGIPAETEVLTAGIYDFVPVRGVADRTPERMVVRRRRPRKLKISHRGRRDIRIGFGNHWVESPRLPTAPAGRGLQLLHFPARSFGQFEKKVANGGAAVLQNPALDPRTCVHWRSLYDKHSKGTLDWHYRTEVELSPWQALRSLLTADLVIDGRLSRRLRGLPSPARAEEVSPVLP